MISDTLSNAQDRMGKAMDALRHNLSSIRTGRASPALLERVQVEYYGAMMPLNQLAGISAPEPRLLVIQPWDRGSIGPIERAIQKSDLGLMPNNDGQVIRLSIPALTEERRKQLVKVVHQTVEEGKVAIAVEYDLAITSSLDDDRHVGSAVSGQVVRTVERHGAID